MWLPPQLNRKTVIKLQDDNPHVFSSISVYDGRSNLFSPKELPFGNAAEVPSLPHFTRHIGHTLYHLSSKSLLAILLLRANR